MFSALLNTMNAHVYFGMHVTIGHVIEMRIIRAPASNAACATACGVRAVASAAACAVAFAQ